MKKLLALVAVFALATVATADPVTPGKLRIVKDGDTMVTAKPGDVVEIQIPNPALPQMVKNIDVKKIGSGGKRAGVVDSSPQGLPGGGRISIFVSVTAGARSVVVAYSYENASGKQKRKVTIQIQR